MAHWTKRIGASGVAALLLACGGSSEGGGGGAGGGGSGDFAAEYASYCKKMAEREVKCGGTPDEAVCLARQACFQTHWRTSALLSAMSCDSARDCNTTDDACYSSAGATVSSPVLTAYHASCTSWSNQCGGTSDLCGIGAGLLTDANLQRLSDCMKKPCTEAATCIQPVLTDIDCFG